MKIKFKLHSVQQWQLSECLQAHGYLGVCNWICNIAGRTFSWHAEFTDQCDWMCQGHHCHMHAQGSATNVFNHNTLFYGSYLSKSSVIFCSAGQIGHSFASLLLTSLCHFLCSIPPSFLLSQLASSKLKNQLPFYLSWKHWLSHFRKSNCAWHDWVQKVCIAQHNN